MLWWPSRDGEELRMDVPADGQLTAYLSEIEQHGFTVVDQALTDAEVERFRTRIERLYATDPGVAAKRSGPRDLMHVENLPNKGRAFETFFLNPRVLPLVRRLVGDDCVLKDAWSLGIPPTSDDGGTMARVFSSLHCEDPMPLSDPVLSVVTLYPLIPFTARNGGTRLVPGSHKWGRPPAADDRVEELQVEAPAGSCLVFVGALWHASSVNRSNQVRTMMGACYSRPWIKPFFDFTRSMSPEVTRRASPEALRLFGFESLPPYTERWQWDTSHGRPKEPDAS
jgi:ectoine hydroxylase-related dioxygenase (phytanoyl-CoA dioxygenase family)